MKTTKTKGITNTKTIYDKGKFSYKLKDKTQNVQNISSSIILLSQSMKT
jgi:hypothetical protein